uniref:G_PROTEIN_RECEP_F1_2 domain-containing protein n=1 Tax=Steinernema glaseri TaxID=37863 RepID=A0A1I7ZPM6_9BILA
MSTSTSARFASYAELFIGVFGLFGNVNMLIAVARKKKLRSKCYLLMALIAFYDTIAIGFEYFQALVFILEVPITTRQCFQTIFMFVFTLNMQIFTVLSVAFDRLLAVTFPTRYRMIADKTWILVTLAPGLVANAIFLPWAYITTNDFPVNGCNPPSSLPDDVAFWWSKMAVATNIAVVVIYIVVIQAIRIRGIWTTEPTVRLGTPLKERN